MATAKLSTIPSTRLSAAVEPAGVRVRRLMDEARDAAREQVAELEAALARVVRLASEVADGGGVYPAGVRDVCERLSGEAEARAQQIAIIARSAERPH
jgi:hypothetical protein